jgi:predicted O-methyltransferase YrrM
MKGGFMTPEQWNPGQLLELSGGYWQTCALHAGVKLDLFSALDDGAATGDELARRSGSDARGITLLLNALAALGLLTKNGDIFTNRADAREFLSRRSPRYIGHIILHHHHLMEAWAHLDVAVRQGHPPRLRSLHSEEEWRESFLLGMFNLAMNLAPQLVKKIDLAGRRRLLDLGGGPGTYAIHFCLENPQLRATVFDLPTTRPFAEKTIADFGLTDRIEFQEGNFLEQEIPGTYDVVWLSHILHGEGPEGAQRIIDAAVSRLPPGGLILVQEFILDDIGCGLITAVGGVRGARGVGRLVVGAW